MLLADAGVEVAKALVSQGRRTAASAVGLDVTAAGDLFGNNELDHVFLCFEFRVSSFWFRVSGLVPGISPPPAILAYLQIGRCGDGKSLDSRELRGKYWHSSGYVGAPTQWEQRG